MAGPRNPAGPQRAGAIGVAVRAVQRAHRNSRQPRRRRAARPARHVSELVLRSPAAALRRSGLRLPGGRTDRRRRHQRQDPAPAGRRRAVRRSLRQVVEPRAGARPAGRHAEAIRALGVTGRQAGHGDLDPAGVAGTAQRCRHRVRGRGGRRIRPCHSAIRAGRQRGPARDVGRSAGLRPSSTNRWRPSSTRTPNAVHC